jgi:anhydro-N-acetylmuramic acid kinase
MDAWCSRHLGAAFDRDGAWAAAGRIDRSLLARLLAEPYFARPAPKSTGRDLFGPEWLDAQLSTHPAPVAPGDVQATLAELTATTIADAVAGSDAVELKVCGGGARNRHLMTRLSALLSPRPVGSTADWGIDPGAVEALAFAWLARERIAHRPGNLPQVTGARGPRVLGAVYAPTPS